MDAIGSAVGVVMLAIAVVGIKVAARVQVSMALVEYLQPRVEDGDLGPGRGARPPAWSAARSPGAGSPSGIDGKGSAVAGFLIAVFVYGGWDGTLYVNEEVKHRRTNPGRAASRPRQRMARAGLASQVSHSGR